MKNFRTILVVTVLSLSVTPFLVKLLYGIPLFGMTINEKIISAASLIGLLNGFQLIMFGLVCSVDYERRYKCSKKLGDLVTFPGLSFNEIFSSSEDTKKVYIDLQKRLNVFSWMNMRKVLRSFGEAFYLRIQTYTSILIFYSLFCVAILNLIVWTELRHHISTMYLICVVIFFVSSISLFAIYLSLIHI